MKFNIKIKYIYIICLILFSVAYIFHKPKPKLSQIIYKEKNYNSLNNQTNSYLDKENIIDQRVTVGKGLLINQADHSFEIIPLSFWNQYYSGLKLLDNKLKINYLKTHSSGNNNFAVGKINNKKVVYSCMQSTNNYKYDKFYDFIPANNDFKYWQKVYIRNLKFAFFSFKPQNYECLLVITSNIKFFNSSEEGIRKLILNKFFNSLEK